MEWTSTVDITAASQTSRPRIQERHREKRGREQESPRATLEIERRQRTKQEKAKERRNILNNKQGKKLAARDWLNIQVRGSPTGGETSKGWQATKGRPVRNLVIVREAWKIREKERRNEKENIIILINKVSSVCWVVYLHRRGNNMADRY